MRRNRSFIPLGIASISLVLTYLALTRPDYEPPVHEIESSDQTYEQTSDAQETEIPLSAWPANTAGLADLRELLSDVPLYIEPAVATKNFSDAQKLRILESIVEDLLTREWMADSREFYGGPGKKVAGLVDSDVVIWPEDFPRRIAGYDLLRMSEESAESLEKHSPFLLIRIDRFLSQSDPWGPIEGVLLPFQGPIIAIMSNYGEFKQGGCFVGYVPALEGTTWTARPKWAKDP